MACRSFRFSSPHGPRGLWSRWTQESVGDQKPNLSHQKKESRRSLPHVQGLRCEEGETESASTVCSLDQITGTSEQIRFKSAVWGR